MVLAVVSPVSGLGVAVRLVTVGLVCVVFVWRKLSRKSLWRKRDTKNGRIERASIILMPSVRNLHLAGAPANLKHSAELNVLNSVRVT